jgi:hypothetical protein
MAAFLRPNSRAPSTPRDSPLKLWLSPAGVDWEALPARERGDRIGKCGECFGGLAFIAWNEDPWFGVSYGSS